jgi:nitrate/nitrite-specific signal transduction histidine kinase
MKTSLRRKILTWTFLPAAIIFLIVAVVSFFATQAIAESLVIDRDRELARLTAAELASSIEEYPVLLDGIARDLITTTGNVFAIRGALAANANRLAYFDGGAALLSNTGRVLATHPEQPALHDQDWSNRDYFRAIIQTPNRSYFSNIVSDSPNGEEALAVAVPVFSAGSELRGVLVAFFRLGPRTLNPFYGTLVRLRLDRKGNAHIIDGSGRVIYDSSTDQAGQDFHDHPVADLALSGNSGALRTPSAGGVDVLASYSPIPNTDWKLVIEEEWSTLMAPLRNFAALLALLLSLGVIVPALVVAAGMQRVTRPINALVDAARQVARGDFGRTVRADTGDELEMLAEQFNRMSAELQASYTQLERRVEARTHELQTVLQVSRNVASTLELQPLLSNILDELRQVVDYLFARLFIMEGDEPVLLEERGDTSGLAGFYYLGGLAETEAQLAAGRPLIVADTRASSPVLDHLRRVSAEVNDLDRLNAIGSFMTLPLTARERRVGVMTLAHAEPGFYTPQRVELAMAFAAQAAVAIENARLFATEQERAEQLRVINQVSQTIAGILDVNGLLLQTAALIHQKFGYYHVGIGLVEGDYVVYRARAGVGIDRPAGEVWSADEARTLDEKAQSEAASPDAASSDDSLTFVPNRLRIGKDGLTGRAAATGRPIIAPDVSQDPRHIRLAGLHTRSEAVVPIKSQEVVIGVLDVQSDKLNEFDQSDIDILQSLANQLAVAIENARLYESAGQLAALEERQKLARELHDSVSQALYGIALGTRTARAMLDRAAVPDDARPGLTEPLDYVLAQADAGMAEMRALIFELRPESLQSEGVVAALRKQTAALQARHQIPVAVEFGPEPELSLPQKEMLYRVAQEAMHNIVKHARATSAEVRLVNDNGKVLLEICDNGQGFDMTQEYPGHLGLKSMRERVEKGGGVLTIASDVGGGTRIQVKVTP